MESISSMDVGVVKEVLVKSSAITDNKLKLESLQYQKDLIKEEKEFDKISKLVKATNPSLQSELTNANKSLEQTLADIIPTLKITPQIAEGLEVLASKSALASEVNLKMLSILKRLYFLLIK